MERSAFQLDAGGERRTQADQRRTPAVSRSRLAAADGDGVCLDLRRKLQYRPSGHLRGTNLTVSFWYSAKTDDDGRFAFDRVPPMQAGHLGKPFVSKRLEHAQTKGASPPMLIDVKPGETAHVELGSTGRPVIGRVEMAEGSKGQLDWTWGLNSPQAERDRGARALPEGPSTSGQRGMVPEMEGLVRGADLLTWQARVRP